MRAALFAIVATLLVVGTLVRGFGISSGINVDPTKVRAGKGANTTAHNTTSAPVVCALPNATASRLHVFSCDRNLPIQILSVRVVNARTNAVIYPLNNDQPLVLVVNIFNKGVVITDEQFSITISEWGPDASGTCAWKPIDTHGAFNDFNGCAFAHDCPVAKGSSQIRIPLHLDKFQAVIDELKKGLAYQLELHIINTSNRMKVAEVGCAVSQGRVV